MTRTEGRDRLGRVAAVRVVVAASLALGLLLLQVAPAMAASGTGTGSMSQAEFEAMLRRSGVKLTVGGGVLGSASPGVSVGGRVAGVRANAAAGGKGVTLVPSTAITDASAPFKKVGAKALGAAGTAATVAWGVNLVYDQFTGNGVAGEHFGFAGLTGFDSHGLACDVASIFGSNCGLAAAVDYVGNADVPVYADGWNIGPAGKAVEDQAWSLTFTGDLDRLLASAPDLRKDHVYAVLQGPTAWALMEEAGPLYEGYGPARVEASLWFDFDTLSGTSFPTSVRVSGVCTAYLKGVSGGGYAVCPLTALYSLAAMGNYGTTTYLKDVRFMSGGQQLLIATYYPPGSPLRPGQRDPNPERRWLTEWTCADGATGSKQGDPWREADPEWPAPLAPDCGTGTLEHVKVSQVSPGLDPYVLYDWTAPAALGDFVAQYPQCTNAACQLDLMRLDATTGARVSCFDQPDACAAWFTDPAKTATYVCTYGGGDVALEECNAYAQIFDRTKAVAGVPTYADPTTGEVPEAASGGGGGAPTPDADCGTAPDFSFTLGGIGYWVAHGAAWALCQAFKPSPQSWPDLSRKSPVPEVTSASAVLGSLGSVGQECLDVSFTVWEQHVRVLDSCGDDPAMTWLRGHRSLTGTLLVLGLAVPLVWWAFRAYAPGSQGNG
jgi:hypothetical protein